MPSTINKYLNPSIETRIENGITYKFLANVGRSFLVQEEKGVTIQPHMHPGLRPEIAEENKFLCRSGKHFPNALVADAVDARLSQDHGVNYLNNKEGNEYWGAVYVPEEELADDDLDPGYVVGLDRD